jgi:hypothetical protein
MFLVINQELNISKNLTAYGQRHPETPPFSPQCAVMARPANAHPGVVRKRRSAAEVCQIPTNMNVPCDKPPTVPDAPISSMEGARS